MKKQQKSAAFSTRETLDHIFIHCPCAHSVWSLAEFGLNYSLPARWATFFLESFSGAGLKGKSYYFMELCCQGPALANLEGEKQQNFLNRSMSLDSFFSNVQHLASWVLEPQKNCFVTTAYS